MHQPLAYLNGKLIGQSELSIPVYDAGFVLGATVTEQMRTFNGKLFRLDQHLDRFAHSLEIVGLSLGFTRSDLMRMAHDLVRRNRALLSAGDDLGLCLFATPGAYPAMAPAGQHAGPTVALHTYPLPFAAFASAYESGQAMIVSDVRQISPQSLPRELKCRSRMHYYLADLQARAVDPAARALLLDDDGCVLEATTANVLVYRKEEGLLSPPREKTILPPFDDGQCAGLSKGGRIAFSAAGENFARHQRGGDIGIGRATRIAAFRSVLACRGIGRR